jgi:ribosomal protein S11
MSDLTSFGGLVNGINDLGIGSGRQITPNAIGSAGTIVGNIDQVAPIGLHHPSTHNSS